MRKLLKKMIIDDKGVSPTIEWTIIVAIVAIVVSVVFLSFNGTLHGKMVTFGQNVNNEPVTPVDQTIQVIIAGPTKVESNKEYEYTASLSGGTGPYTYKWGPMRYNMTSNGKNASYMWYRPGSYVVALTVTDVNGKTGQGVLNIEVHKKMFVALSCRPHLDQNKAYINEIYTFHASVQNGRYPYNYQWSTNGYLYARGEDAMYMWRQAGDCTVSVTVTDADGNKTHASINVKVLSSPPIQINLSGETNVLTGIKYKYTASVSGGTPPYTYAWTGTKPVSYYKDTAYYRWNSPGNRMVVLTVTDAKNNTATEHLNITVTQNPNGPKVSLYAQQPAKTGQSEVVTASVSGGTPPYTYKWTPAPIGTNNNQATYKWENPGLYRVTCDVTDANGIIGESFIEIRVDSSEMKVEVSIDKTSISPNETVYATAYVYGGQSPYTYSWTAYDTTQTHYYHPINTGYSVGFKFPNAGTYIIQCMVTDSAHHSATDSGQVIVKNNMELKVGLQSEGNKVNVGQNFRVTALVQGGSGAYTYSWSPKFLKSSSTSQAIYVFTEKGTYTISCTVTDNKTRKSASASETVYVGGGSSSLSVEIIGNTKISVGQSAIYTAVVKNAVGTCTYRWSTQGLASGQGTTQRAVYKFMKAGQYVITCTVTDSRGKSKTGSITVMVSKSNPIPPTPWVPSGS